METLGDIVKQENNELRYNRKHIDLKIRDEIETNPIMMEKLHHGCDLIAEYMTGKYYDSKMARIAQLKDLDIPELVMQIFIGIAYCQTTELFTSVTAQLASRLKFSDKTDAIKTVAEIVAVLCATDAFDIDKEDKFASLTVLSKIPLSSNLIDWIMDSEYLPPMVCTPLELKSNFDSGYLTHKDSLVLGSGNHHDGDLCLDVLNLMNRVPLKLDLDFLCQVEEEPTFELNTQDKKDQWKNFKVQSYRFYSLMQQCGNRFHFCHKVDKRGRIYSQGFHLNPQGTSFKKAQLEFADEEIVEGVPDHLRI